MSSGSPLVLLPSLSCIQYVSAYLPPSRAAHLPWIRSSSAFPRNNTQQRRQAQGAVVACAMGPSKVSAPSNTTLSRRCKVCGEAEQEDKRFLICGHSLCTYKYYHIRCLSYDQIASYAQADKPCWYCPSCLCRICLCNMDDDMIILCDGCDEGHHLYCMNPRRTTVPRGKWYCYSCNAVRKWEGQASYEKRMLKFHRKDAGVKTMKKLRTKKGASVREAHQEDHHAAMQEPQQEDHHAAVQETQQEDEDYHGFNLLCAAAVQMAEEDEKQVVPAAE